jgi:HAD superfamily hydrolase (TIGR01549 family)
MSQGLQTFERLSRHPNICMVSVDIFDTLLLRTTLPERVKFGKFAKEKAKLLQAKASGKKVTPKYLHLLRTYAARIAYRNKRLMHGAREATLDEIYDVMFACISVDLGVSPEGVDVLLRQFRNIELELEKGDLRVNHQLKEVLTTASTHGKKVVAISDMYLSRKDIQELLVAKGVGDIFDYVYVSSEFGFGKASGNLFDEVLSRHELLPCQVTHIGDNWFSDYRVPKEKGIFACHYPRSFSWRALRRLRTDASLFFDGRLE